MTFESAAPTMLSEEDRAKEIASLKAGKTVEMANLIDESETSLAEDFVLPGGETAQEEASIEVMAEQADEFTCASCFMVRHRTLLAREDNGQKFCSECEG
ncbi:MULTISPECIES: DUF4193 family protein [Micrococcaceae]|uniref:DUF4193 family protein n=1 Tax=Micrococcaceae TaxID=1268 RepID=UPI001035B7F8|nr:MULTISPECIES: DUF4193 family protein [Micrococcaceae]TAP27610.1 DUF4193 domain-containing protein [Arthrobacter sp. S41]UXN30721.1 DUF4193 domain-containing protein [Glutamicibacter sp. M10]